MMTQVDLFRGTRHAFSLLVMLLAASAAAQNVVPAEPVEALPATSVWEARQETNRVAEPVVEPTAAPLPIQEQVPVTPVVVAEEVPNKKDLVAARVRDTRANPEAQIARDRAAKPKDAETVVRLQIYLDQKGFGPGFIDGKAGKFTTKAVHAYNRGVGRLADDWVALLAEANASVRQTYATAVVPEVAADWVNPRLPFEYSLQSQEKRIAYRSYLEFMAERYHTSETFLVELNGAKKAYGLRARSSLRVPNVDPFLIEKLTEGRSHGKDETLSARTVVIDTVGRNLFVYEKGTTPRTPGAAIVVSEKEEGFEPQKLVAMFPITPGKVQYIHRGEWAVANCFELPGWGYDKQFLETGKRSEDRSKVLQIPPGPNLPVGILWSGLTKSGIGIHGSASPRTIGRSLSAGCIRLSNWDAARFPALVRPGARVVIR